MKYLIEIHHGIGDVIQMSGLLDSIREVDPDARIDLILNKDSYRSLFQNDDRVHNFYTLDMTEKPAARKLLELRKMRGVHYDYFLMSPISNKFAGQVLAIIVNSANSYGEQFQVLSRFLNKYHYVINPKNDLHIVERNHLVLQATGITKHFCYPRLNGINVENCEVFNNSGIDYSQPSVAMCIGTSKDVKEWPFTNYLKLSKLAQNLNYNVIFVGGQREQKRFSKYVDKIDGFYDFMGKTSLFDSVGILSTCQVAVGGDTGMMHACAALGVKTITLFGPTDAKRHAPYSKTSFIVRSKVPCTQECEDKDRYLSCQKKICMPMILYEEVEHVFLGLLSKKPDHSYQFQVSKTL